MLYQSYSSIWPFCILFLNFRTSLGMSSHSPSQMARIIYYYTWYSLKNGNQTKSYNRARCYAVSTLGINYNWLWIHEKNPTVRFAYTHELLLKWLVNECWYPRDQSSVGRYIEIWSVKWMLTAPLYRKLRSFLGIWLMICQWRSTSDIPLEWMSHFQFQRT